MASNHNDPVPGYIEPGQKKSNSLLYIFGGIAAAVVVFCCLPCGGCIGFGFYQNYQTEQRVKNEPGTKVTTAELNSGAMSTYNMQVVVVTGKVTSKQLTGVTLDSTVDCLNASSANAQAFQNLNIGQEVTIKGLCQGKPLGPNVQVANAQIVK